MPRFVTAALLLAVVLGSTTTARAQSRSGTARSFAVSGFPSPQRTGVPGTVTIRALDSAGNTATGYRGTVRLRSSDPAAVLPPSYTFTAADAGRHTFSVTLRTTGTQSITASDTRSQVSGTQRGIVVTATPAAPPTTLSVGGFPSPKVALTPGSVSVTARDATGAVATGYRGTVHFTSSDPAAVLPADTTFTAADAGTHSFQVTLATPGTQSVTATDVATPALTGTQSGIVVTPPTASTLTLAGFPSSTTAGVSSTVTVTARDSAGNVATGYLGTVHFTSSDPTAVLPPDYTFTAADAGTHTFPVTLGRAGSQSITVSDTQARTLTSTQSGINVLAGPATALSVAGFPSPQTTGVTGSVTVTSRDAFGNTATGYRGTVHLTSSDPAAVLPPDYTFGESDAGAHVFPVTLVTVGTQSITGTDTLAPTITGTQSGIVVAAKATEPAFYATPTVVGATHVVTLTPAQSLQSAFNALQPGDVLELQAGTYPAPNYPGIEKSGTPNHWIFVRGAAGTRPVIDLQNTGELHVGGSYVSLENVEVVNGLGNNLHIVPTTTTTPISHVILRNISSHSLASGTGAALKIAGNWSSGTGIQTEYVYVIDSEFAGSRGNALVDAVGVRYAVMRGCYLHDPVNTTYTSPGVFFKGGSSNILIEGNLVRGIRRTAAIMVGGNTGTTYFDALYANPPIETVNQVVRNNLLADFDDAAFEIRGVRGAKIYGNTMVTQTTFVIFRLAYGGPNSATQIPNYDVDVTNNLVLASDSPRYAMNSANTDVTITFGHQLWGGSLSPAYGPGLPTFPLSGDVAVPAGSFGSVVVDPTFTNLTSLADAEARYRLVSGSPARGAGTANTVNPRDIVGTTRSATAPSIGAFE